MYNDGAHVDEEEDQEEEEVFVVPIAKAVVDEVAVMVKFLNTPVAEVAVGSVLGS